jgi:hypothetical protein
MSCENCEEGAYVIDKLAKLLAEIAVIVNGPEPHDTLWSYHDLPEKVRALKQAPPAAVPAGYDEDEIADACMMAEVPDSKYEAIIAYLGDNRRRAAARKGE